MMSKPPSNKKKYDYPAPFCLRFTQEERKALEDAAGDKPLGAYIKWLIFGKNIPLSRIKGKKPVKDQQELAKLLAEFGKSKISNNINQLAKAANSGSLPVNIDVQRELNEAVNAVKWMRQTLIKALGLKS